jgi:hypothetical protein
MKRHFLSILPLNLIGLLMAAVFAVPSEAFAMSICIPDYERLIDDSNTIVVGKFEGTNSDFFLIEKVLKSPENLGKKLLVYAPQSPISDINGLKSKMAGKRFIFLGSWVSQYKVIVPECGHYSFWPYGPHKGYLPTRDLDELERYIESRIKNHPPKPTPTPNPAEYNPESVKRVEQFIREHRGTPETTRSQNTPTTR